MRIPLWLWRRLDTWARHVIATRDCDQIIHTLEGEPYLYRWHITPYVRWAPKIMLHLIVKSDDDRALHDHPWVNCSILLEGEYVEILSDPHPLVASRRVMARDIVFRRAVHRHRLVLPSAYKAVLSIFITGPKIRAWGFWCPQGWRHWQKFTEELPTAENPFHTRGCE